MQLALFNLKLNGVFMKIDNHLGELLFFNLGS
jgi:hypothetical protein